MKLESSNTSPVDTRNRPLRDLRISVTDRCNFRCTYCMPAEIFGEKYEFLPRAELLTFEEIAEARGKLGIWGGKAAECLASINQYSSLVLEA